MSKEKSKDVDLSTVKFYSLTDIEKILGVTHRTVLLYVRDKKLKAFKVGGQWRVTEADLKEFIGV